MKPISEQPQFWIAVTRNLAHQMGTPLSALMGWVELLPHVQDPTLALSEMQRNLEHLHAINERLNGIGSQPAQKACLFSEIASSLSSQFKPKQAVSYAQIEFHAEFPEELMVVANRYLLSWALESLLKNAADALPEAGGCMRLRAKQSANNVIIEIEDNGCGISSEQREALFDLGYSTKSCRQGLGLGLARYIIEVQHQGKLILKSNPEQKGTTWQIILKNTLQ